MVTSKRTNEREVNKMLKKNADKLKRKQERETFVGFRPSVIDHKKNYNRKVKHKKAYSTED